MTVVDALRSDLESLPAELRGSALAEMALALAADLDSPSTPPTARANCARALNDTLEVLRKMAPDKQEVDGLDDLAARRAARLDGQSKAARKSRS